MSDQTGNSLVSFPRWAFPPSAPGRRGLRWFWALACGSVRRCPPGSLWGYPPRHPRLAQSAELRHDNNAVIARGSWGKSGNISLLKSSSFVFRYLSGFWWSPPASSSSRVWRWGCTCQCWGGWWRTPGWRWCPDSWTASPLWGCRCSSAGWGGGGAETGESFILNKSLPGVTVNIIAQWLHYYSYGRLLWFQGDFVNIMFEFWGLLPPKHRVRSNQIFRSALWRKQKRFFVSNT